jgi:hypothetical protein
MKRRKNGKNIKEIKTNETGVDYSKMEIKIFHSFEEAEEYDAMEMAKLTPEEHLKNTTELIQSVFADELKKKNSYKKIYFRDINEYFNTGI